MGAERSTGPGVRGLIPPGAKHHLQSWGLEPLGKEQGRVAVGLGAGLRWRKRKGPAPSPRRLGVPGSLRPPQTSGHAVPSPFTEEGGLDSLAAEKQQEAPLERLE